MKVANGDRFGRWTVLEHSNTLKNAAYHSYCKCDCGTTRNVSNSNLVLGKSKSCGCIVVEIGKERATHGMSGTNIYQTWHRMIRRCNNPDVERYPHYGGRGIKVCDRWTGENGFSNFYEDIGDKPEKHYSLGRIDNDGNYELANCRWETPDQQMNNMSRNIIVSYNGLSLTISQWANKLHISYSKLISRYHNGTNPPELFDVESKVSKPYTVNGITRLTTEWMREAKIPISSWYHHKRKGLTEIEIIEKYLSG